MRTLAHGVLPAFDEGLGLTFLNSVLTPMRTWILQNDKKNSGRERQRQNRKQLDSEIEYGVGYLDTVFFVVVRQRQKKSS